jgi:imidazole glycerol-phosphate synthase
MSAMAAVSTEVRGIVSLLDYGAGNVRSLRNAIRALGYEIVDITTAEEIAAANVIVFPGVGIFGQAMQVSVSRAGVG